MPLLGVLGTPVTLAFGAFVTTTLFFTLAFPLSSLSAYVLISRWVRWRPAAFVGGLLYGFSPYLAAQGGSHLNLVFVPLPPLIFFILGQIAAGRARRAWMWGTVLALLCAAQFLISAEILVSTVVVGVIGLLIAAVVKPSRRQGALAVRRARHRDRFGYHRPAARLPAVAADGRAGPDIRPGAGHLPVPGQPSRTADPGFIDALQGDRLAGAGEYVLRHHE